MPLSLEFDEAKLIRAYFAAHPRVGTIIDVGAQFGTSFRDYLNDGWRAIAFEPDPSKFEKLAKYEGRAGFALHKVAVGEKPIESLPFYTSPESTGISSLLAFRDSHQVATHVRVVVLGDVLKAENIKSIDYLKIDTEGYDLAVLRGHDWSILPEVIMCEFDEIKTRHLGHTYRELADLLTSHGYEVYVSEWAPIIKYGGGYQWRSLLKYPCPLGDANAWGNLVAVAPHGHRNTMSTLVAQHA